MEEELIARYCIILALFEEVYRSSGASIRHSPITDQEYTTIDALLAVAQPHWVDDLSNLAWLFHDRYSNLLSAEALLNPTFDGSADIGGADADLIIDGYLLDIKTTINPNIKPEWLYQLVGYVLLDYSDMYQLNGAGFYLARQGELLKWPLREFLNQLTEDERVSLEELRLGFRELLKTRERRK